MMSRQSSFQEIAMRGLSMDQDMLNTRLRSALVSSSALLALSLAVPALGQIGTGSLTIEASRDGITWTRGEFDLARNYAPVRIRILAEWSNDLGMYAFAGAQGDIAISNAGGGDVATNMIRPGSFASVSAQTIVASRFGSTIKIDDSRDTAIPGAGSRGVFAGQLVEQFAGTNFTRGQPVSIFEFTFTPDASGGTRQLTYLPITPAGDGSPIRHLRVYTSPGGAQNSPVSTLNNLRIVDIPAPGSIGLASAVGACACRRRR
jgi:hypothetical protein